jgi:hypothetical protein
MRRVLGILASFGLLALASVPAWAAPQKPPPAGSSGPTLHLNPDSVRIHLAGSREELLDANNQSTVSNYLREFLASSATENQDQLVTELTDFCIERGVRPAPDVAEIFLSLAVDAKEQGKMDEYQRLTRYAASFAPTHPPTHLALADVARLKGGYFSGEYLFETVSAMFHSFQDQEAKWTAMTNLALWLRITAILLLAALALLLLVRYSRLLRHDVREWLGGKESKLVEVGCLAGLFLPSLLLLSGYWWIVWWAGVFLIYARWMERVVVIAASLLLIGSGAFYLHCQQQVYLDQSPPHVSNLRCYASRIGVGPDAYLSAHVSPADPLNYSYSYLLASRYLLHGSYVKAENLYQALLKEKPDDAKVLNNIGCIYFYENRFQEAIRQFSKAIEAEPDLAAAYLNRAMASNKVFDFTGSEADQQQARNLDNRLFDHFKVRQSEEWGPLPIWLPQESTRAIAMSLNRQIVTAPKDVLGRPLLLTSYVLKPAFSFWMLVFTVGFIGLVLFKKPKAFARACFKCGQPFCSRCKTSLEFESFCSQCVHLYIKQDGVSPEARLRKNYEVERFNRIQKAQRAVFALLAPGSGHFFEGRPITSLLVLFLWCGAIGGLILGSLAYPLPFPTLVSTAPFKVLYGALAGVLMLALWLLFGLPMALRQSPPQVERLLRG